MKTKYVVFISMLAALFALTSCLKDEIISEREEEQKPIPEPTPEEPELTPAEAILGDWYVEMVVSGERNDVRYDTFAVLLQFQQDGKGLWQQYFLEEGQLVYHVGSLMSYTITEDGAVTMVTDGTQVAIGENTRIADGNVLTDILGYHLVLAHPTETQQQKVYGEWGVTIVTPDQSGEDPDDPNDSDDPNKLTEVTDDGADEPARAPVQPHRPLRVDAISTRSR